MIKETIQSSDESAEYVAKAIKENAPMFTVCVRKDNHTIVVQKPEDLEESLNIILNHGMPDDKLYQMIRRFSQILTRSVMKSEAINRAKAQNQ